MSAPETVPACELVGHEGAFRLPGGRRTYEAVLYNVATARSGRVRLARIVPTPGGLGLRQINRWVDWEQPVVVIEDYSEEPGYYR